MTVPNKVSDVVLMVSLSQKVHLTKGAQLLRLVRILSTDVVQMAFHQLKVLKIGDVLNLNVRKLCSDVVRINILQLKEKTMKVAQFQQLFLPHQRKKLIQQLCQSRIGLEKIVPINLLLRNPALSINLDVAQMVKRLLKDPTSKDAMTLLMRKIVVTQFMDAVMMVKHQPPHQIRKTVLPALKNLLAVVPMVTHQLMVIMLKDAVLFTNMDVVQITSTRLVVPIMKVVIATTHLTDVAQTRKHLLMDMIMLVAVVNRLNLDVVLISSHQHQEAISKVAHVILCNSVVVQMVSQFHVDLTTMVATAPKQSTSAVLMTRPQLKDPTSKDVLAPKVNSGAVKMVFLKLKEINSKDAQISKKSHKKPAHCKSRKEIAKTIQSNTTSTITMETATGSGTVDVEETATNLTQTKNANKLVPNMLVKKPVCYQKVLDPATVANRDSTSMLITTDAKNSFMEDATEIPTTSRPYKSVKAYALPSNLHVSIF